ncbi:hypothetical protein WICMUC_000740 [Wickerhamomyces mucosus]|uniref:5-formyltetrahydrofolate cyclo-ligase n=1 Tax=Wickerhamomyces mucosus TaxID=1378264 RepID=A0A9P8TI82_9ASCO|nr:hypothetical protein WICMUC_000740 [Wickerhamomyces mucosus]
MNKNIIRKEIKLILNSLTKDEILIQSNNVISKLIESSIFQNSKSIAIYMSMDNELQTLKLIEKCFQLNKIVYLPHCYKIINNNQDQDIKLYDGQKSYLKFFQMDSFNSVLSLEPIGKFKLKEPTSGINLLDTSNGLDLLILPGVAFTKKCGRLGHGMGFYDDFIKRYQLKFQGKPILIGIGLKQQLIENLPLESHDELLDYTIIDDQIYKRES